MSDRSIISNRVPPVSLLNLGTKILLRERERERERESRDFQKIETKTFVPIHTHYFIFFILCFFVID